MTTGRKIRPALILVNSVRRGRGSRTAESPEGNPDLRRPGLLCPVAVARTMTLYRRHHPIVGIYQFSPVDRGSCSEQSITSRRMFFQRSPVSRTKQRLCRQNEGSRTTGDSFGADEFSDGHAIVIRHSSIPPPRLLRQTRCSRSNRGSRTAERLAARAIDS